MLSRQLRRSAPLITVMLIFVGFTLVMTRYEPLGILGFVLLVLAPFVPFLSLGIKPDPVGWNRERDAARSDRPDGPAGAAPTEGATPDATAKPRATSDPALRARLDHEA